MIRPVRFAANPQTADSNAFQKLVAKNTDPQESAVREFDALVEVLKTAGVDVRVFDDTAQPHTPDAIFPNNWVTTHADGTVVLYPMQAPNRRLERRMEVIQDLQAGARLKVTRLVDMSSHEGQQRFLEGTGSLVLDRVNQLAYACLSPRTEAGLLQEWGEDLGYEIVAFHALDAEGRPIYHTNVMMCVGDGFAVVCGASIAATAEREKILRRLGDTGHEIVDISFEQMNNFAGNMLQIESRKGDRLLAMSRRARASLTREQIGILEKYARIVSSPIDTIEDHAGGSVRCMMAEVFLPPVQD